MRHPKMLCTLRNCQGFSLVEMSIVLAIISVILAGILPFMVESSKSQDSDETVERMEAVEEALLAFYTANSGRMPCPADGTLAVNSANFGVEADVAGTCTGGAIQANFEDAGNIVGGGVPTKSINLPDEYAFDGWGRRLSYHVTTAATTASTTGTMTIEDHAGANRTTEAMYVLVSHGPTGHGAFSVSGARYSASITNTKELENCDCDSAAVATAYDDVFVMGMEFASTDPAVTFDDLLRYRTEEQVQQHSYANADNMILNVCPAGFTLIGTAGTRNAFCIHTDEQGPSDYYTAEQACNAIVNARGNARLCTASEWYMACNDGTPNDMIVNGDEWIAHPLPAGTDRAVSPGDGNCDTLGDRTSIGNNIEYRCCQH